MLTVLNRLSTHVSDSKKSLLDLISSKRSHANGLCCISVSAKDISFVYAHEIAGKTTIEICDSYPYKDQDNLLSILTSIVKDNELKRVPCSLMLQPEDYQLLVTDVMPVTPSEFQAAIRWKLKDLLRYPLDDVVLDSFNLPKMKTSANKIMVVAAQASKLKTLRDLINKSGLELKYIDVPELALRNILAMYQQEGQSSALIYLQENSIQLLILFQQQIYVSRVLKFSINTEDESLMMQGIDRLTSEIQRSLDYYQSLWEQPNPSRYLVASIKTLSADVTIQLAERMKASFDLLSLSDNLVIKPKINNEQQMKLLLSVGGALRKPNQYQQEINLLSFLPKKTGIELTQKVVLISYGAFFLVLCIFYFGSTWQKHKLENQINQLANAANQGQQQFTLLSQKYPVSDVANLKQLIGDMQKEYETKSEFADLISPNANFSSYLTALGNAIVPGVWLTEIIFDRGENKVVLKGYALLPTLLERFYAQLSNQPVFSNLSFEINEIKQTSYPTSFNITAKKVIKT